MIRCERYDKQYVGETKRQLKDRSNERRRRVYKPTNKSKPTTVSEHFLNDHHTANDISFIPLELVQSNFNSVGKARQTHLIRQHTSALTFIVSLYYFIYVFSNICIVFKRKPVRFDYI